MNAATSQLHQRMLTQRSIAIVAVIAAAVSVGLGIVRPAAFWPAYLVAVVFVLGNALGCLLVALLHRMTGGRWGLSVLRELIAGVGTIPLAALLLIPLLAGASDLYPWLGTSGTPTLLNPHQQEYFAPRAWIGRSVAYVVLWTGFALFAVRGYRRTATATPPAAAWYTKQRLSAIGLIVVWLAGTFAAMDWLMALEPKWGSTIYGAIVVMDFVVGGWSLAILLRYWADPSGVSLSEDVSQDLGNMLLAFLLIWVYLAFSQYLIIWSGDLPHEISWYLRRTSGLWGAVGTGLLIFHFAVPFALLLFRENKRHLQRLVWVAATLLVMRLVDLAWLVFPAFDRVDPIGILLIPLTVIALGGGWLWIFVLLRQKLPGSISETAESAVPANSQWPAGQEGAS